MIRFCSPGNVYDILRKEALSTTVYPLLASIPAVEEFLDVLRRRFPLRRDITHFRVCRRHPRTARPLLSKPLSLWGSVNSEKSTLIRKNFCYKYY